MACHTRSNSFPSRSHLIIQEVDAHLCRLSSSSEATSKISNKLNGLQDLHDCVDRLLQLPQNQQALSQEKHQKSASELLDGSLRLLDICNTAKDILLQTKECMQSLQSIIRRKGKDSEVVSSEIKKYLNSKKMVKRAIQKAMNLYVKKASLLKNDQETISIVAKLREDEAVSFTIFETLLSFISGPKSKASSWSMVSKMVQSKRVACDENSEVNEFSEVDNALKSFKNADIAQNQLSNLESCIRDQEEAIESLFRQLIKTRVSLLNILNN